MSAIKKLMVMEGIFLFLLYTLSSPLYSKQKSELLENYLTYVLSIGAEGVPSKYLIAGNFLTFPYIGVVAVDDSNNVYVGDENRIKVYNQNGKAKAIIGGPGIGPGEFRFGSSSQAHQISLITIGPTGYVTAKARRDIFNVFNPKYKFINTFSRSDKTEYFFKIFTLNKNEYVYANVTKERKEYLIYKTYSICYAKNDAKTVIASYTQPTDVTDGRSEMDLEFRGFLFYDVAPKRTIMYTQSRMDEMEEDGKWYYIINTYNIDTGNRNKLKILFTPDPLPNDVYTRIGNFAGYREDEIILQKLKEEEMKKRAITHYEAFDLAYFDRYIMYIPVRTYLKKDNKITHTLLNIIDTEKGELIRSIYTPSSIDIIAVKNGYLYSSGKSSDGYTVIDKYKIDPKLYQK
jgi:hypothetical protein